MQDKIKGITTGQFAGMVAVMLVLGILGVGISYCNCKKNHVQSKADSTDFKLMRNFINKTLIRGRIKKIDSIGVQLGKRDTIFVDKWHKAKEYASLAPDTCLEYILRLKHACDSMRLNKDSVILNLRFKILEQDSASAIDSSDIALLYAVKEKLEINITLYQDSLANALRKMKNWRTVATGEGIYIILREGSPLLTN